MHFVVQVLSDQEENQLDALEEIIKHIPNLLDTGNRISGVILDMT